MTSVRSQKQGIHQDVLGQCGVFCCLWKLEPSTWNLANVSLTYLGASVFSNMMIRREQSWCLSYITWIISLKMAQKYFLSFSFYLFWEMTVQAFRLSVNLRAIWFRFQELGVHTYLLQTVGLSVTWASYNGRNNSIFELHLCFITV